MKSATAVLQQKCLYVRVENLFVCLCLLVCPAMELTSEQFLLQMIGLHIMMFSLVMGSILGPQ